MQRKLFWIGLVGCLVALGGCTALDEMNAKAEAQQNAADQAKCTGYGYQSGTDAFADCMMNTAHHRDMQKAIARQQDAMQKQQQADQWERDKAENEAGNAQRRAEFQQQMNSQSETSAPAMPTGTHCTSTTTSQQSDNADSSTTTTECH